MNGADPKGADRDDADVSAEDEVRGDESSTENAAPIVAARNAYVDADGNYTELGIWTIALSSIWGVGFLAFLFIYYNGKYVRKTPNAYTYWFDNYAPFPPKWTSMRKYMWRHEGRVTGENSGLVLTVAGGLADITWNFPLFLFRAFLLPKIITYPDGFPTSHVWYKGWGTRAGISAVTTIALILGIIIPLAVLDTYRRRELVWKTYLIRENERAKGQFKRIACNLWRDGKKSGEDLDEVAEKMQKIIAGMPVAMPVERGETISAYPQTESWQSGSAGIHVDQYRMFSPGVEVEDEGEDGDKIAVKEANLNENLVHSTSNNLHVYELIDATTLNKHVAIDPDEDGTTCGADNESCALLKSMDKWCADDLPVENLYGSKVKDDEAVDPYKPDIEKVESDDEDNKKEE